MGTVRFQGEHFMVTIQNYVRAKSLEEAYELNQKKGNCILGGMLWTKMQNRMIQTAIDLCDLGLNEIEETEEEFSIGAMVSLRQLETDFSPSDREKDCRTLCLRSGPQPEHGFPGDCLRRFLRRGRIPVGSRCKTASGSASL